MLFRKKRSSLIEGGILDGAVDNHSHILYGVDDGVRTLEESLTILQYMEEQGFRKVWLTPHTMEDVPNTTEGLKARFEELKVAYKGGLELDLASEYMMDPPFVERMRRGDLLFHDEDMVLVETSTWSAPYEFWDILEEMMSSGYRPVVAHPERYRYMEMKDYERLHKMGCRLQLNIPSIVGFYGSREKAKAEALLGKGWYDMAGTDTHRFRIQKHWLNEPVITDKVMAQLTALVHL